MRWRAGLPVSGRDGPDTHRKRPADRRQKRHVAAHKRHESTRIPLIQVAAHCRLSRLRDTVQASGRAHGPVLRPAAERIQGRNRLEQVPGKGTIPFHPFQRIGRVLGPRPELGRAGSTEWHSSLRKPRAGVAARRAAGLPAAGLPGQRVRPGARLRLGARVPQGARPRLGGQLLRLLRLIELQSGLPPGGGALLLLHGGCVRRLRPLQREGEPALWLRRGRRRNHDIWRRADWPRNRGSQRPRVWEDRSGRAATLEPSNWIRAYPPATLRC
jgi:hypothetical protein